LRATISIGATLIRESDDVDSILKRADALLYESKEGGRNRLTMSQVFSDPRARSISFQNAPFKLSRRM